MIKHLTSEQLEKVVAKVAKEHYRQVQQESQENRRRVEQTEGIVRRIESRQESFLRRVKEEEMSKLQDAAFDAVLAKAREDLDQHARDLKKLIEATLDGSIGILAERREVADALSKQVSDALEEHRKAHTALVREFEAMKAGFKIGKG